MSKILVSGLVNVETTCSVGSFPISYQPIDYIFFGTNLNVSGVGYNIASALKTLGDKIQLVSVAGRDLTAKLIFERLKELGVNSKLQNSIDKTPLSVILYDGDGRRRIFCDLKDIQNSSIDTSDIDIKSYDLVVACNINFSRSLLNKAKEAGVLVATDVHVQHDINDEYNKEFMQKSDILFLSNEGVIGREEEFVSQLSRAYNNRIIVMGLGSNGAIMYERSNGRIIHQPAPKPPKIINTVGAGDALFSSFISLYAKGYAPEECLRLAQIFAVHKIGFDGGSVGFLTLEELLNQHE